MSETVKNWLWYTFYGVCVLVLVVIGVYTSVLMSNRNKLKTEIEKARKRGDLMTLSELEDAYKRRVSNTRSYPSDFDNFEKQFDLFSDSQPEKWKDLTQHVMKSGPGLKKQMQEWDSDKREQKIQKLVRFTGHYQVEIDQLLSKRYPPAEVNFYKEPGSSGLSLRGRSYFVSFYAFLQLLSGNTKEVRPALAWLFENANIRFKEPIRSPFWNGMDLRDGGYWLIRELLQQDQVATKTLREVKRLLNNHPNLKTVYRKRFREEVSANFWWLHGVMTNDKQVLKHAGPIPFSFTLVRPWLFGKISDSLRNYHQWLNLLRKRYPLVKKKVERLKRETRRQPPPHPKYFSYDDAYEIVVNPGIISLYLNPYYFFPVLNEHRAKTGLLSIALDVKRHLAQHGSLSKSIDEFIDRTDPFSQSPFRHTKRNGTLILYSVGNDLTDDGGRELSDKDDRGDIVVKVPIDGGSNEDSTDNSE